MDKRIHLEALAELVAAERARFAGKDLSSAVKKDIESRHREWLAPLIIAALEAQCAACCECGIVFVPTWPADIKWLPDENEGMVEFCVLCAPK